MELLLEIHFPPAVSFQLNEISTLKPQPLTGWIHEHIHLMPPDQAQIAEFIASATCQQQSVTSGCSDRALEPKTTKILEFSSAPSSGNIHKSGAVAYEGIVGAECRNCGSDYLLETSSEGLHLVAVNCGSCGSPDTHFKLTQHEHTRLTGTGRSSLITKYSGRFAATAQCSHCSAETPIMYSQVSGSYLPVIKTP